MRKILILILSVFLFADQNPFEPEQNTTDKARNINGIIIYNLPVIEENKTKTDTSSSQIPSYENDETNESYVSRETNATYEEVFINTIKTVKPSLDIAVVIDKKLFKPYLSSIINSLNSYLIYKNVEFNLNIYDVNEIQKALEHKNIIFYTYNTNTLNELSQYNNNFYFPMINKYDTDINNTNFYFGGIDYKSQINKLNSLITQNNVIAINDATLTSQKLYAMETEFFNVKAYAYRRIYYNILNNSYVFLNTSPQKSVRILANIYYKNIKPKLILSTQINFTPVLIAISQSEALKKLIIANSIINPPLELVDINKLLLSDIKFNWLNYSASILCNNIYNKFSGGDEYLMNDFSVYMYDNQINFKTKLYQVVFKAFKEIYSLP